MKKINNYIIEKFKINSKNISKYKYHPKDKDELMKLLDKLIEERGWDGDFNDIDTSKITEFKTSFFILSISGLFKWDFIVLSNIDIFSLLKK